MIRVLHVVPNLMPAGAERMAATLAIRTDRRRFQASVASLYDDEPGSLSPELAAEKIRVFHLGKRPGFDFRMFDRFRRLICELRPNVVHTHNYVLRYTLPATLIHRTPALVHTVHNLADREVDRLGRWIQWMAFRGCVAPVVIAEAAAESFERVYGMKRPPLIMNGIDVAHYGNATPSREDWRKRESFASSDLLFVCAARFSTQKNHAGLLRAFALGPARLPQCRLVLAGDGDLRGDLEKLALELSIGSQVRFLGRRDDVPAILGACDIFVLASLWEGNPLSVMEAMAAGLPCVVSAAGGIPELVESGEHGEVTPVGDIPALAAAMLRVAGNPAMRRKMRAAVEVRARTKFDAKHMVEAYEALYEQFRPAAVPGGAHACAGC
jgi:glycosyltransferase involved in cell wall biosynthesis